jgi:sulfhydrogenase subunit gamma (sulfur reductase)
LHGVRHSQDLIFSDHYEQWQQSSDLSLCLAAQTSSLPNWYAGFVTSLIAQLSIPAPDKTVCFICGPEIMMHKAAEELIRHQLSAESIFLSLERNMHCGVGHCGHCQCGAKFVCKNGPVFSYDVIRGFTSSN